MRKIMHTAELAASLEKGAGGELVARLQDSDSAVRYWAGMGTLMRGADAVSAAREPLRAALADTSPYVRTVAAEALGKYGNGQDLQQALTVLLELAPPDKNGVFTALMALNALDALGAKAKPVKNAIRSISARDPSAQPRTDGYAARLIESLTEEQ